MKTGMSGMIHALEFDCQAPLKFYEHCVSCPRFGNDCPDLALGMEILRGKKKLFYDGLMTSDDRIDASNFNCLAPLKYFEKSRKKCAHKGRCREEGLLISLLKGKNKLEYSQKRVVEFPRLKHHYEKEEKREVKDKETAIS